MHTYFFLNLKSHVNPNPLTHLQWLKNGETIRFPLAMPGNKQQATNKLRGIHRKILSHKNCTQIVANENGGKTREKSRESQMV